MATDSALLALMVQTVILEPPTGARTLDGIETYGAAVSVPCRIEFTNRRMAGSRVGDTAVEVVAKTRIYCPNAGELAPTVTIRHRITLPDGSQPVILGVESQSDERGPHHQVIWT